MATPDGADEIDHVPCFTFDRIEYRYRIGFWFTSRDSADYPRTAVDLIPFSWHRARYHLVRVRTLVVYRRE